MTLFTWFVIIVLTLITALYVAAEFAAVGVRRSRIRMLSEEGNRLARLLLPFIEDPRKLDRYIAASQIGITLSSLILGAYGQATLSAQLVPYFEKWGSLQGVAAQSTAALIVLIGLTTIQVVLGELVPKSLALQYPVQSALFTVLPMRWSLWLFSWSIAFLNGSGLLLLRVLGVRQEGHRHIHSPQEIDMLIAESRDGGLLEPDEHERLHRALQLSVRPAHKLMVPRLQLDAIDASTPVAEMIERISTSPYTRLPVYRDTIDNIIGTLHTKKVLAHYLENGGITSIESVLQPILRVPENVTADRLLTTMREHRTHQAIVVDEFGGVEGLITLDDVLAELLGDFTDELKADEAKPEQLSDGRVRLPGMMHLDDAEQWVGTSWESSTAATVSGYVTEHLGHIPIVGERITIDNVEIEVEKVDHHAIVSLLVTPLVPEEEEVG